MINAKNASKLDAMVMLELSGALEESDIRTSYAGVQEGDENHAILDFNLRQILYVPEQGIQSRVHLRSNSLRLVVIECNGSRTADGRIQVFKARIAVDQNPGASEVRAGKRIEHAYDLSILHEDACVIVAYDLIRETGYINTCYTERKAWQLCIPPVFDGVDPHALPVKVIDSHAVGMEEILEMIEELIDDKSASDQNIARTDSRCVAVEKRNNETEDNAKIPDAEKSASVDADSDAYLDEAGDDIAEAVITVAEEQSLPKVNQAAREEGLSQEELASLLGKEQNSGAGFFPG